MSKDKDAFKRAMAELQNAVLDDDQRDALAVVERYSGELRRQAAELKAEASRLERSLAAAEEKIVGLQKFAQENAVLEDRLRASDNRVEALESQVLMLRRQVPEAVPESTETRQAVSILTRRTQRVMGETLKGWDVEKANETAFHFASLLMLMVCQYMAKQNETDTLLEKELVMACQRYFDRVAPGQFTWKM